MGGEDGLDGIAGAIRGYEVLKAIGGRVYLARDRASGRHVALKVPRGEASRRLLRRAQLWAQLEHRRVVAIERISLAEPVPFLVMEHCARGSVADLVAASSPLGDLPPLEVVKLVATAILEALGHAHERGVFHAHLKPANILFDASGGVKVSDFGTGTLATARAYMAPEQAEPARRPFAPIDARTDIFALGKVVYELASGCPPTTIRALRNTRPWIARAWDDFVLRCLEERPQDRFQDVGEALEALRALPIACTPQVAAAPHATRGPAAGMPAPTRQQAVALVRALWRPAEAAGEARAGTVTGAAQGGAGERGGEPRAARGGIGAAILVGYAGLGALIARALYGDPLAGLDGEFRRLGAEGRATAEAVLDEVGGSAFAKDLFAEAVRSVRALAEKHLALVRLEQDIARHVAAADPARLDRERAALRSRGAATGDGLARAQYFEAAVAIDESLAAAEELRRDVLRIEAQRAAIRAGLERMRTHVLRVKAARARGAAADGGAVTAAIAALATEVNALESAVNAAFVGPAAPRDAPAPGGSAGGR